MPLLRLTVPSHRAPSRALALVAVGAGVCAALVAASPQTGGPAGTGRPAAPPPEVSPRPEIWALPERPGAGPGTPAALPETVTPAGPSSVVEPASHRGPATVVPAGRITPAVPGSAPDAPPTPDAAPTAAPAAAEPDVVVGTLVRAYAETGRTGHDVLGGAEQHEHAELAQPVVLTWVETPAGAVPVATDDLGHVPDGATVRVVLGAAGPGGGTAGDPPREVLAAEVLALPATTDPVTGGEPVQAAATPSSPRRVTVVMVQPAGAQRDSTTVGSVVAAVEGPVSSFWSQQTGGAVSFDVVAQHDWITTTAPCSAGGALWDEVAAKVRWTAGERKHLLLYVSTQPAGLSGCYAGLGTVGALDSGGKAYVRGTRTSLIAHELGHNLGLGHSDGMQCDGVADAVTSACTVTSYRDRYDVMGLSWDQLGTLTPQHATSLGAMTTADRLDVTGPTQAVLAPISGLSGVRALRIVDGSATYWVEYRPAAGRDAWLAPGQNYQGLLAGVLVRRTSPTDPRGSLLLDGTPSASSSWGPDWQQPLPVGATLRVASGAYTIRVDSVAGSGAAVSVAARGVWAAASSVPVQLYSPAPDARVPAGAVTFTGTGTAPEGTLQYEVTNASGAVVARSFTATGANGESVPFSFAVPLQSGTYTVSVWASDDSDGESPLGPRPHEVRRTFVVG